MYFRLSATHVDWTSFRIFNFQKAYAVCPELPVSTTTLTCYLGQILDELIVAGELQESSKKSVLRVVRLQGSEPYWYPNQHEHRSHKRTASRSRRTAKTRWHGWAVSVQEARRGCIPSGIISPVHIHTVTYLSCPDVVSIYEKYAGVSLICSAGIGRATEGIQCSEGSEVSESNRGS